MVTHVQMNHDSDKEMDLLLKRHARRGASGFAGATSAGAATGAQHMDADELSAYAEGALPALARARYAGHLADCDSCRRIITELVVSSGLETEERGPVAQTVVTPARSWREWLAALFSPPALRFAAPALALVAFASIVFVVINRNREVTDLVTTQRQNTETAPARETQERNDGAGTSGSTDDKPGALANSNTNGASAPVSTSTDSRASNENTTASRETGEAATASAPKTADVSESAPPPPPSLQESTAEAKATQPAQTTAPTDSASERAKEKDDASLAGQKKQENSGFLNDGTPAPGAAGGRTARSTQASRAGALGSSSAASGDERQQRNEGPANRPATAARARRDTSGADEESQAAPTRTVAGKRFRQQNGIWVDTAYSSSRSASRVKRGSERFRALVADEPIIGTVANSFGGDVIVVAGGRAYHIY